MSVMKVGALKAQLNEVAQSTWHAEPVRYSREFDVGILRIPFQPDRRPQHNNARSGRKHGGKRLDWDDRFSEAVGPLLVRLHHLARRILGSDDLADDAVQEAIFSLWKEGTLPSNPGAWLNRAVVHRSLHFRRSRHRRRRHERLACIEHSEYEPTVDPARAVENKEIGVRIDDALSTLSDRLRHVFVLREIEQMDYESIAARLDIPLGTVRSRLARSREALQQVLGHEV